MIVFIFAAELMFVAAQGAAIFATAFLALRVLRIDGRGARLLAMVLSYAAWILATIAGYMVMGGEGGLMDGFGMVLMLCFSALVSSIFYAAVWTLLPSFNLDTTNG